jgi:hypothetical protein
MEHNEKKKQATEVEGGMHGGKTFLRLQPTWNEKMAGQLNSDLLLLLRPLRRL